MCLATCDCNTFFTRSIFLVGVCCQERSITPWCPAEPENHCPVRSLKSGENKTEVEISSAETWKVCLSPPAHFHSLTPFKVGVHLMYLQYLLPVDRNVMLLEMHFLGCKFAQGQRSVTGRCCRCRLCVFLFVFFLSTITFDDQFFWDLVCVFWRI